MATERDHLYDGLRDYTKFKDCYKNQVIVRDSSTGDSIWLFCYRNPKNVGDTLAAPRLNKAMARRLIRGLEKWLGSQS
jgi:hypothetical protein